MESTDQFNRLRPRLFGIAYRMLGVRAEAEDIVQDAYLRWHGSTPDRLRSAEAWLVTIVTRLCIDRLRSAMAERAAYFGPWLPEPLVDSPETVLERASDVSMAFLVVLERLAAEERAAFLLHQVFEFDYAEISAILDKSEAACRQIVHRARERVRAARPRFAVSRAAHIDMLEKFVAATRTGNRDELAALFTADASYTGDGGGKAPTTVKIVRGADRVARLYEGLRRKLGERMTFRLVEINGEPGLLKLLDGHIDSALSIAIEDGRIAAMYVVRNPDKLARVV